MDKRPVLEQLAEAVKWWNADEAEEPDVRRLFAACKAEIERLQGERDVFRAVLEGMEFKAIDAIPAQGVTFARSLGCAAKLRAEAMIAMNPWPSQGSV